MNRRVVITGMGIWSCLGTSIEQVAESLKAGKSGIGVEEKRLEYGYRSPLTGIVSKPELKGLTGTCGGDFRKRRNMPIWPLSRLSRWRE